MAENSSAVESWTHRPAFLDSPSWISGVFARENEALTKALQISLSDDSSASETLSYLPPLPSSTAKPDSSTAFRGNIPNRSMISRKISKRKSRASKRTPTTYINADPANFRRMVQEVTGIRIGEGGLPVEPVVLREPEWSGLGSSVCQPPSCLTTLDTSALLLDRVGSTATACGSFGPVADSSSFFDFESFPSFPTLDSWGTM
ncbi:calmodulin-binding protein 25-like [Dendrobium catenatum]|uniref:VQ domain-containing protein n=1 Tax=Dendrobium catenatum TaxID=906689 RepID=A0A2I0WL42_9ASPA|nr:calmodulin-binding protein 25-like [Dendrobium catenatum]PKU76380.1 hypothetical protein MA16_Dca000983 [Dendrobium catenatum]